MKHEPPDEYTAVNACTRLSILFFAHLSNGIKNVLAIWAMPQ